MKTKFTDATPRVRFNWGFWDGQADRKANRRAIWDKGAKHVDDIYEAGYRAGQQQDSHPTSSQDAWDAYQKTKVAARNAKRELKQARPQPTRRF